MDIDYHYYAIRTLAAYSGFSDDEAQTVACYSQQVDDFTRCIPMFVNEQPPAYFIQKGFAKKLTGSLWMILPHPTGIDVVQSMEEHYRKTTLAAFHFLPKKTLDCLEKDPQFTRSDYRCVRADEEDEELIGQIVGEAVSDVQKNRCNKSLMKLGMALHTYADTYAHCGYSGLEGWENCAVIKGAKNLQTQKEEVSVEERIFYSMLPHIGHGNAGHVPDICSYRIDVAMQSSEKDKEDSLHIKRDNIGSFLKCSHKILDLLCDASGSPRCDDDEWRELSKKLESAMQLPTEDETNRKKLSEHWGKYFPDIKYHYEKDVLFYSGPDVAVNGKDYMLSHVTEAFYDYNELAYRRAEQVLGTDEMMTEYANLFANTVSEYSEKEHIKELHVKTTGLSWTAAEDEWMPDTALGDAVYGAGFAYIPEKDIIGSTINNAQRMGGYCHAYDVAAPAMSSIIDCEPVIFCHGGFEWMIELWKGQYGIETGCEIGVYYREQNKPETDMEKNITGKWYECAQDEQMLDMSFSLQKNGKELFSRDMTKHWWLTGFHWGVFSEPEELDMTVTISFPDREMLNAFQSQLKVLGYDYEEPDQCSVRFVFSKPHTAQPSTREKTRERVQQINLELVQEYNEFCKKYDISCSDPNLINRVIDRQAGIAERKLYEKLISFFRHINNVKGS